MKLKTYSQLEKEMSDRFTLLDETLSDAPGFADVERAIEKAISIHGSFEAFVEIKVSDDLDCFLFKKGIASETLLHYLAEKLRQAGFFNTQVVEPYRPHEKPTSLYVAPLPTFGTGNQQRTEGTYKVNNALDIAEREKQLCAIRDQLNMRDTLFQNSEGFYHIVNRAFHEDKNAKYKRVDRKGVSI